MQIIILTLIWVPKIVIVDKGNYPARACASRSYVIRAGVHLYVCMYIYTVCISESVVALSM